ncbi:MAG: peptidase M48 [Deltaproteobacteria bacterium]|nr:MAG: peptidase M48 [Deltaproteobacteria bacterium]
MVDGFRVKSEKTLFVLSVIFSLLAWLALVISIAGIVYALFIGFFLMAAHAIYIAHVRGQGVLLSTSQLPEIYERVESISQRFGLPSTPEVYVMESGGILNAMAAKLFGRQFVIIYSDLIEACEENPGQLDFIIGHEIAHHALGHLKWHLFIAPSFLIPLLGTAYSRAREYSCDLAGLEAAGSLENATRGLAILAAGGKLGNRLNMDEYIQQVKNVRGFWSTIYELNSTHPYTAKRVSALANHKYPETVKVPGKNPFAYPLAPFFGAAVSPAAGAPFIAVAIVGILASIAIPQYLNYVNKANESAQMEQMEGGYDSYAQGEESLAPTGELYFADDNLRSVREWAFRIGQETGEWPCEGIDPSVEELSTLCNEQGWELEINCNDGYCAVYAPLGERVQYRAIWFGTGELVEGVL